jgi:hypothetical protein
MEGCSGYLPISRLSCLHFCNLIPVYLVYFRDVHTRCVRKHNQILNISLFFNLMSGSRKKEFTHDV